jgi:hypothetical protein
VTWRSNKLVRECDLSCASLVDGSDLTPAEAHIGLIEIISLVSLMKALVYVFVCISRNTYIEGGYNLLALSRNTVPSSKDRQLV